MKKRRIIYFLIIILIIIIILLLTLFHPKSYTRTYDIKDYTVTEEFANNFKEYYYQIKTSNIIYEFIIPSKFEGKELLTNIKEYTTESETCLIPSNKLNVKILLCSKDNLQMSWHLVSDEMRAILPQDYIETPPENIYNYNDLIIHNNPLNKLYIWNYYGFDFYDKQFQTEKIFNSDVYNTDLISTINEYIIIPDYEQEYNFDKIYLYNTKKNELSTWQLDYQISMDSYIIGTHNKSLYLIDKKNIIEYELVPHKKKMRIIANDNGTGGIYDHDEWIAKKVRNIISDNLKFTYQSNYHYEIIDNNLYLTYDTNNKILISNKIIDKIIATNNDEIYYLVGNKLYYYSPSKGEILLIEKEEWLFNNTNKIFPIF